MDVDRIKEIGPNMACAEWLMKNGARLRWKGYKEFVNHYDCLPTISCGRQFQIEEVYAGKESSISHIGFRFFGLYTNLTIMEISILDYINRIGTYYKMSILQSIVRVFLK